MYSTLPTGNESPRCMAMPRSEPAATTWYCGVLSQKYFSAVIPPGAAWISSRMISVSVSMAIFRRRLIVSNIFSGSRVDSKMPRIARSCSKLTYAHLLYAVRANSFSNQVLPTCRAPRSIRGLRLERPFHSKSLSRHSRFIVQKFSAKIAKKMRTAKSSA